MEFKPHVSFSLSDRSFLNVVKRDIAKLAESYGLGPAEVGKVNIVVAEMTSNLIKHNATEGEILVKPLGTDITGIEIICLDKGPGMSDVNRMMEDGVSTAGTNGEGLGAIKRMSDEFDIYSCKGVGTYILARLYKGRPKLAGKLPKKFEVGVVMVPKTGETKCGDAWALREELNKSHFLVADGLGHGEFAEIASQSAVEVFRETKQMGPSEVIRTIHQAIKRTRGAVGNVATINLESKTLSYCGVGNIAGRIISGHEGTKSIISYNGILGHNIPTTMHNHDLPWNNNSVLILHSDGLKSKWDLVRYKDVLQHSPSLVAALMYKEFSRGSDDTLVLICRTRA
ncbi:MAG: stage II sporulation protein E [Cytophagales bacterium CG18_big_fil_WC_8_21_14_2_50_42_9]|nr:MAG: stage II sporulation protein E [Cytophagales bacterium CG18_big_fil_WC_8_21_14_2_50_42_9]